MTYNPDEIAEILQQLKQEVRSQRLRGGMDQSAALTAALEQVQLTSWVNPHQPIAWPHWPKGLWPKVMALIQKLVRRLLCWYINPIIEEQNDLNAAVATALDTLAQENARLRAELRVQTMTVPARWNENES
jgi:hypothetical protein